MKRPAAVEHRRPVVGGHRAPGKTKTRPRSLAAEQARYTRVALDALRTREPAANPALALTAANAQERLPFNRKERYFTGTVTTDSSGGQRSLSRECG